MPRLKPHPDEIILGIAYADIFKGVEFPENLGGGEPVGKIQGPESFLANVKVRGPVERVSGRRQGTRGKGEISFTLGSLAERGLILVFHQTQLGINEIQRRFMKRAKGSENEIYSSRDIYRLLRSLKVSFDFVLLEGMLDVSDLFALHSHRSDLLLNFFLECRADLLSSEFKKEVVSFIKKLAIAENGRQLIHHPVGVFCISRSVSKPIT